jgi:hypothetical protein
MSLFTSVLNHRLLCVRPASVCGWLRAFRRPVAKPVGAEREGEAGERRRRRRKAGGAGNFSSVPQL